MDKWTGAGTGGSRETSGYMEVSTNPSAQEVEMAEADPNVSNKQDGITTAGLVSAKGIRREKLIIWKNILIICLSFTCLFMAYGVVLVLQSSLNSKGGMGMISQSVIYVAMIVSALIAPTWLIKKLGLKWTMVISQLFYSTYIAAQFYPTYATLISTAILIGFAAAPLWAAQSTYVTKAGEVYTKLVGEQSADPIVSRFFGVTTMLVQTSTIFGNVISSAVLGKGSSNGTTSINEEKLSYCGANFCNKQSSANISANATTNSSITLPSEDRINILFGIMVGFSLLAAVIMALFLDNPRKSRESTETTGSKSSTRAMLLATVKQAKRPYQQLIIPFTIWTGIGRAFMAAEFSAGFIACSWGVEQIGYIMLCFGVITAVSSGTVGFLVKYVGRLPIFILGTVLNCCLILTMLFFWRPDPSRPEIYFIVAGLWGVANGIWSGPILAFYGVMFSDAKEAAFSNLRLWQSIGFAIAFAYSPFLCMSVKLYICMANVLLGMACYLAIELMERRRIQDMKDSSTAKN